MVYLIVGIYLVGYILCYRLARYCTRKDYNKWTKYDRAWTLRWSVISFLGILVLLNFEWDIIFPSSKAKDANW